MTDQQTDIVTQLINGMEGITKVLWSAAALLAPWLVPLAPAIFLWWAVSQVAIETGIPQTIAMTAGFVAALGLECVNIAAAHAAVQLSHRRKEHAWKFILAVGLVVFYVLVGVGSMTALGIAESVSMVGVVILFLLAPVAITAQALTMDLVWTREEAEEEAEREAGLQALQLDRDYDYKIKLAELRWQHKTDIALASSQLAQSQQEPAPREHVCLQCGRSFATKQAVGAHSRFCAGTNGRELAEERKITPAT